MKGVVGALVAAVDKQETFSAFTGDGVAAVKSASYQTTFPSKLNATAVVSVTSYTDVPCLVTSRTPPRVTRRWSGEYSQLPLLRTLSGPRVSVLNSESP